MQGAWGHKVLWTTHVIQSVTFHHSMQTVEKPWLYRQCTAICMGSTYVYTRIYRSTVLYIGGTNSCTLCATAICVYNTHQSELCTYIYVHMYHVWGMMELHAPPLSTTLMYSGCVDHCKSSHTVRSIVLGSLSGSDVFTQECTITKGTLLIGDNWFCTWLRMHGW